jgi:hypothetical protein
MKKIFVGWTKEYQNNYDIVFQKTWKAKIKMYFDNLLYNLFLEDKKEQKMKTYFMTSRREYGAIIKAKTSGEVLKIFSSGKCKKTLLREICGGYIVEDTKEKK